LRAQLDLRTRERDAALEQQAAASEVLRSISRSTFDLKSVLNTLVESAARLCEAYDSTIWRREGDRLVLVAHQGPITVDSLPLIRGTVAGRTVLDGRTVHLADMEAEVDEFPESSANARRWGVHTILCVPLMREGVAIGTIALRRTDVQLFTERQVALLRTFSDQAVIAIENVRLLNELRQRTDDLTESLEQQTATSQVLSVISSSPADIQPVLEIIGDRAEKLCNAEISVVSLVDGELIHLAAINGVTQAGVEAVRRAFPMRYTAETVTARAIRTCSVCHVADVLSDSQYQQKDTARISGYRGCLGVPMVRDEQVVGAIFVARRQPGLFSDAQVQLLKTFSDQAVIAVENVRLFNETKTSLEQQTATANVLKVISRSTFDLQTVFQTLIESAARLCAADRANISRVQGGTFQHVAVYGFDEGYLEYMQAHPLKLDRGSINGRAALDRRVVHLHDVLADPEYTLHEAQKLGSFRTALGVPLLREGIPIGTMFLGRSRVEPFTQQEIDLVATFADQAVIAIENVRLFDELQKRTGDLTESLEQQTATSEVLRVISSSPGDLEPVFQAMLENATRICEAKAGNIYRWENSGLRLVTSHNATAAFVEVLRRGPLRATANNPVGRMLKTKSLVHIADLAAEQPYIEKSNPVVVAAVDVG
jgi:GAF domain-containing protein